MSYRIGKNEALSSALNRIAAEEIALAQSELGRGNQVEAMHNTRKALKRLRSLLRTLQVAVPRNLIRRENRKLAAAGRRIAPLRDVHVQVRTMDKLRPARGGAAEKIEVVLRRREEKLARQTPTLRLALRHLLRESQHAIAALPMDAATPENLAAGFKRIYKRGRASFKTARAKETPESLHEWRKQTKVLWHALELAGALGPKDSVAMAKDTARLCQVLGDDHDLFMVLGVLEPMDGAAPGQDLHELSNRIARRRRKLRRQALKLGGKVYAPKPGPFFRRLKKFLSRKPKKS